MLLRLAAALALAITAASTAVGAPMGADEKAALQQQCTSDFTTFCGDLPPEDSPEVQACFEKNMSKLSPGCQSAIKSYKQGKKG